MDLTVVIPVLNEEESVEKTARDCLQARALIMAKTPVRQVNVVVVSDGSTDRSVAIAQSIPEVTTIVFEQNRGYGAAIQAGWEAKPAELLGFLDGDGTCDASFFVDLVLALEKGQADVALGSRMGDDSQMPRIRRIGNWIFAMILGLLSRQSVTDSASGMRVVRRRSLSRLLPLPDGLHFTPAMSARAMIGGIPIVELPMPYRERDGKSKLSVIKDGLRFMGVILAAAIFIRPSRLSLPVIAFLALISLGMAAGPIFHYLHYHALEEWMIYRLLLISLIANVGVLIFCMTLLAERIIAVGLLSYDNFMSEVPWWWGGPAPKVYAILASLLLIPALVLIWPGLSSYVRSGTIAFADLHWSRPLLAALFGMTFVQFLSTYILSGLVKSISMRQRFILSGDQR